MGVPHQGSDSAKWASFAANLLKSAGIGTSSNTALVSNLVKDSTILANISDQFVDRARGMIIYTFYETKRLNVWFVLMWGIVQLLFMANLLE